MRLLLVAMLLLLALPAGAQRPDARKAELDQLFTALKAAPTEAAGAAIEGRIRQIWQQQGSPAVMLLLNRGSRDLSQGEADVALDALDDALVLAPDYPEAWLRRALARFHRGDYAGAIRDIEATLSREPRYFPALQTLSRIAEAQGNWKGALAAWEKVLEITPRTAEAQDRLEMLRRKVFGEST
ncbi:Tetratricopeptide repeat protein [Rhodovastum atsumiense]|uniref:Tetratricopeptide repeat protein n=1 Tax=Rhodovastum atsumiense TaxID=504468 RepID=A0A5M6J1F1_9PROT|nr:tetratricopeptide repeat protein [Rhodovastum atsumiense]KAA5614341.1 tetratricopeptide repeat protein [Rhodovastum atsumiense]CAH2604810.1 Tetratricopeptide repeat protein [Rhodovastum atsumiense]